MIDKEYQEILKKREALGDNWRTLLEEIIDDLIESDNGYDDLYTTTERAFRLRDLLNKEFSK